MHATQVLVLDFGSQYTQLIARRIREERVYCEIQPCTTPLEKIRALKPRAIILSGSPSSVFAPNAPRVDAALFDLGVPILGICYGVQLTCHLLGGEVQRRDHHEYGPAQVRIEKNESIMSGFDRGEQIHVWMSHADSVVRLPDGFEVLATTATTPFAAVADTKRKIYGVQFHPEVVHTPRGAEVLRNFVFEIGGCTPDWTPSSFIDDTIRSIKERAVGDAAVCGLSGGVDSSVAAVLVERAIGEELTCVFVDNGLLRKHESERVLAMFKEHAPTLRVIHVNAAEQFLSALKGVTDPEQKRKIIGRVFIEIFDHEASKLSDVKFLVQGTLYPDVIESVSVKGPSSVIKTHHNVGGLPETMKLKLIEPLRELFKDEVREVGQSLGLPRAMLWRHPFPGPGLAIRCLGEVTEEKLRILRDADEIMLEEVQAAGLYDTLWQAFCVVLPVRTVGVMGDERTYDYVIAIRCVTSNDGMTADWARLPHEFLAKASSRITNEVRGANRVVYDISSKPPSTIEWE